MTASISPIRWAPASNMSLGVGSQIWEWGGRWETGTAQRAVVWCPVSHPPGMDAVGTPHWGSTVACAGLTHPPAQVRGNKPSCLLAEQNHSKLFTLYKPNIGRQSQLETFDSLCRKFHRVGAGAGEEAGREAPGCACHWAYVPLLL